MSYNSKYKGKQVEEILDKANSSINVTESTVANWGFTKNTGTYSKPSSGIPKSDLASAVQTSLGKADTALQSVPSEYVTETELNNKGYATSSQLNTGFADAERKFAALNEEMDNKQPILVSGTNIKTINGNSILGSGNIVISGGGSSSGGGGAYAEVSHGTSDTTFTLTPNTFHVWGEVASLDLSFGSETSGIANEYLFQFTSGATATTLTLPDGLKWANELIISSNTIFQVSVLKGLASVLSWDNSKSVFPALLVEGDNGEIGANVYQELNKHIQLKEGDLTLIIDGTSYSIINYNLDYDFINAGFILLKLDDGPVTYYYVLAESGTVEKFMV